MAGRISIPVREHGSDKWAALTMMGESHDICGEKVKCIEQNFSFLGQHRVRLYRFKKNVHWRLPKGIQLDIAAVPPAGVPRRPQRP